MTGREGRILRRQRGEGARAGGPQGDQQRHHLGRRAGSRPRRLVGGRAAPSSLHLQGRAGEPCSLGTNGYWVVSFFSTLP